MNTTTPALANAKHDQPALTTFGAAYERVTAALRAYGSNRQGGNWNCPAHDDKHPSLSVNPGAGKVLLHCFAGCETETIVESLGLDWPGDLSDSTDVMVKQVCDAQERYARMITGRTALTDRDGLLAEVKLARANGSLMVICASRTIAEMAGVSRRTVPVSLARIAALGLHQYAGQAARGAARYTLSHYCPVFTTAAARPSFHENTGQKWDIAGDAAQWAPTEQGVLIGKRGMMLWCALTDEPATVRDIAALTGIPASTVDRWLRGKLGRLGYALQTPDGWVRGYHHYNPDTDSFAGPTVANRKAQHARDREQWARVRRARKYRQENPGPEPAVSAVVALVMRDVKERRAMALEDVHPYRPQAGIVHICAGCGSRQIMLSREGLCYACFAQYA